MSGWIAIGLLAAAGWLLMWRVARLPRIAWEATAAALVLGLAGYGLFGRPWQPGQPVAATAVRSPVDERAIDLRQRMGEGFGSANNWLLASEGALRAGIPQAAVTFVRSGIDESPRNADLWVGLGNALVAQAEGNLTPAARLAFAQARRLAPDSPAPRFFLGLALARAGDREGAGRLWAAVLRDAPADADWRPDVAAALGSLDAPRLSESATPPSGAR